MYLTDLKVLEALELGGIITSYRMDGSRRKDGSQYWQMGLHDDRNAPYISASLAGLRQVLRHIPDGDIPMVLLEAHSAMSDGALGGDHLFKWLYYRAHGRTPIRLLAGALQLRLEGRL